MFFVNISSLQDNV